VGVGIGSSAGPKYLNSPETPVFEKGRELYGLPQARDAIRGANRIVVVEGYMDVVMLGQHGVENAVATLGTATTPPHVQKLLRQADEVVFCFDGDAAGRRAAWHALEVSLESLSDRKTIRFLFLPAEHDPDSYIRAFGREGFESEMTRAEPLSAFLLSTLKGRVDLTTLEGRSRLIAEAKPLLRRVAAAGLRMQLVKAFAEAATMSPFEAARLMGLADGTIGREERASPRIDRISTAVDGRVEREILACVLAAPELADQLDVQSLDTSRAEGRAVVQVTSFLRAQPDVRTVGGVLEAFRGSEHEPVLAAAERVLLDLKLDADSAAIVVQDAQANLLNRKNKTRHAELRRRIDSGLATSDEQAEFARLSVSRPSLSEARRPSFKNL